MDGKLIFTKYENLMLAMLFQKSRILAAQVLPIERNRIGSIYVGKVKNISANIGACFVEIADGEICFLSRKEAGAPFLLNRSFWSRLLQKHRRRSRQLLQQGSPCLTSILSSALILQPTPAFLPSFPLNKRKGFYIF